ncbi:MAG: response regulator [Verrucomicrobia bacterium]|nr:response regulator [Verrucomicrobiota bacterium]
MILERLGYVVRTFESPELALQAFQGAEPKPVLIITDYAMHAMNGLQLAAACRRIQPKQKVLLVSGSVETDFLDRSMVHPDAFLGKPYLPSQLIDAVNSVLAAEPCMR